MTRAARGAAPFIRTRLWHWHIDTANFAFDAYGDTADECRRVMRRAWERHQYATGAEYSFADVAENAPRQVRAGQAWRDGEPYGD